MISTETLSLNFYDEIKALISIGKHAFAEEKLSAVSDTAKTAEWHFLYSTILINKTWFDSAKQHLQTAASMAPGNEEYKGALAELMRRYRSYSDGYYRRPYYSRRRGCCCCCGDGCCEFSCCDLICLDSCCECMGGDLIECI